MCKLGDNTRLQQFSQYFKQKYNLDITFESNDYKRFQYTIKNTIFIDDSQDVWIQKIKNDLKMLIKQEDGKWVYEVVDYYPSNDGSCGYVGSFETEQQAEQCAKHGHNRKIRKAYIDYKKLRQRCGK